MNGALDLSAKLQSHMLCAKLNEIFLSIYHVIFDHFDKVSTSQHLKHHCVIWSRQNSCDMTHYGTFPNSFSGSFLFQRRWRYKDSMNGRFSQKPCLHLNYAQIHFIVILQIVIYTPSSCLHSIHTQLCTINIETVGKFHSVASKIQQTFIIK